MNPDLYIIHASASIKEALEKIDNNHMGFILSTDSEGRINGLATDGDIRRKLLNGFDLNSTIETCTNKKFFWANPETPRELLLKQLDHKIRFIPILDDNHQLCSILTRDYIPEQVEERVFSRSKAPVRISFGGGGSDVSPYFNENNGAVINATISIYSHSTLRIREDEKIFIHSRDLKASIDFQDIEAFLKYKGKFGLIQSIIKAIRPSFGFELFLHSDFPMNSGLGGSAVVSASVLGCFNQFRSDKWDQHEMAEIAFQAERLYLGVSGGWQDQYAAVFGGLNFMEFTRDQNVVHPIRLPQEVILELEESLILSNTCTTHDSGNIHNDQKVQTQKENIKKLVKSNVELTYQMRNHLLRGRLLDFGKCLNRAWEIKRSFSTKISNTSLDTIYAHALDNGVVGGKLLGAGGGGFFLFYVPPFLKHKVLQWIEEEGMIYTPFKFEESGLQSWTVREKGH